MIRFGVAVIVGYIAGVLIMLVRVVLAMDANPTA